MKLINSSAKFIPQTEGLSGIYKQIELCGRTCYKSENLITDSSADKFVDRMINSNHTAMLEHGTIYLYLEVNPENTFKSFNYPSAQFTAHYNWSNVVGHIAAKYRTNNYSKVITTVTKDNKAIHRVYITTNFRVIVENKWFDDLQFICNPTKSHEKRYTFKFICDRGISHELVRHRTFSFAQESTRYCNYNKEKFNNEITCIIPSWSNLTEESSYDLGTVKIFGKPKKIDLQNLRLLTSLCTAEEQYMELLKEGSTAQEARQVLPNALKTEICMTGFASDWRYFFDLRLFGKTGAPHPDMKLLAEKAKKEAEKVGIWEDIMKYSSKFN